MVIINVSIKDEIETKFRKAIYNKFGMKKGNYSKAVNEALEDWAEKNESNT